MALKSKTFDIFYNLCPLKSKPFAAPLFSSNVLMTRRHLFTDENDRIFYAGSHF